MRPPRRGSRRGTWRSSSSTRSGSPSSTRRGARRSARPTCSRSRSTRTTRIALGERELGDVFICPEYTADLVEAVVHGVLHLTGMDHEDDEGEMLAVQAEIMGWLR